MKNESKAEKLSEVQGISEKSDKINTNYSVEKIDNGYILSINKDWKDSKGNYQYESKKKYFVENPLDETTIKLNTISKALK